MPKGKHTPNKKQRRKVFLRAEQDWVAGTKRESVRRKLKEKRMENRGNGQGQRPQHKPTISNLQRVREAIRKREAGGT